MKLSEAKYILEDAGYIIEDTDEYDDADLGINVKPKEYHKQKAKMASLKDRVIQAYEDFIRRKEKDAEQSWKKSVKYRGGGNDEDDLIENYEDWWEEKFPHKNTMTVFEFYKILMANYDTRSYIKENSKVKDLEDCLFSKNENWHITDDGWSDDKDDDDDELYKPDLHVVSYCKKLCKSKEGKKLLSQELNKAFSKAKNSEEFYKAIDKIEDHYWDLLDKATDKWDEKKLDLFDQMTDALSRFRSNNYWFGQIISKSNTMDFAKKCVAHLFKNNFSVASAVEVYNKIKNQKQPKTENTEGKIPPIVKVMYKTFMNKMKTKLIYRAVEVDVDWVDDQLDDMEDEWHQEDKAEYLRKNKYKERMGLANVNLHAVGKSWCWNDDTSAISGNGGDEYMIVAENDPSNIDLTMSALCAAEWSHFSNKGTKLTGEEEVRILDELNVTVLDVYTGSGKQRTHLDRKDTYYRDEH